MPPWPTTKGYDRLAYLCYRIGNRLSGSVGLEHAIAWSVEQMKAVGLSNVQRHPHQGAALGAQCRIRAKCSRRLRSRCTCWGSG